MARSSIRWSGDVYVDLDLNYDDVLADIPEDYIRDWMGERALHSQVEPAAWLDDPVKRLEVITWLRANGYTVEPTS